MKFYVMSLFPQMILDGLNTSITGRAIDSGVLSIEAVDIRDFSNNKHMKVDDYPYGGGAGMVMQPGPVCDAYESIAARCSGQPHLICFLTLIYYHFCTILTRLILTIIVFFLLFL